ncbi:LysR family transcriptional regulator [Roseovarius aestuarii]|nr:LysR family transcriptional regulator [Roseovarius aestuarii]
MRFTLRQLSYFIAAGETGSVTRAAERVNISQPSVSAAISHLETEFGVQLFVRQHAQGLALTPAGKRLLKAAKLSMQSAHGLYSVASDTGSLVSGEINVGSFQTFAPLILPELWRSFSALHPGIQMSVVTGSEQEMVSGLRQARIDTALTYDLHLGAEMTFTPLSPLPTFALLAADHPLAGKAEVTLAELVETPFLLLDLPLSRQYFLTLFEAQGVTPRIRAEVPDPTILRSYVAAGIGFSLMTARPLNTHAQTGMPLAYVPLAGDHAPLVVGLARLRELAPTGVQSAFEAHCRQLISPGNIPGMQPFDVSSLDLAQYSES